MSDRHMHITSYLYGTDPDRLAAFEAEAQKRFQFVQRVVRSAGRKHLIGGDPCPVCGRLLQHNEDRDSGDVWLEHQDPQCGWRPSGYPSTWRGQEDGRAPFDPDGRVIAFVLYSKDSGYGDLIYTLPEAAEALSGILEQDIEIVSAWESVSDSAQRVWPVRGSGSRLVHDLDRELGAGDRR